MTDGKAVNNGRLIRVWGFIAQHAGIRDHTVSLRTVCEACIQPLGMSGAEVTIMNDHGRGTSAHSTDDTANRLGELQFTLGEGPSVDAFVSGAPVLVSDLESTSSARSWPMFAPAAVDTGARAMFVFPLRTGAVRLGIFVLYRQQPGSMDPGQVADALVFADVGLQLAVDTKAGIPDGAESWATDGNSLGRLEVHQATGMVSVQMGVSVEEALVLLRARAFADQRPLVDVAHDVVTRRLRFKPGPDVDHR